ncbi:MAG TPA: MopE-related protein [Kofleriaceae bacterium]|nr:MopE-related protein [Kofleriaceae bacterium]
MRKLLAWLGVAALSVMSSPRARASGPTALKPYIVLILDTSGSMEQATGSGPPTCAAAGGGLLADTKLNHAKCAIYDIANSYGDMVLGLGRFRNVMSGTISGTFPNGCCSHGPDAGACNGQSITCSADASMFETLSALVDGQNALTAVWVNGTGNTCTASGTDPEIWNADSNTPLEGVLRGAKCYWGGQNESTSSNACVAIGSGDLTWPTGSAGYNPIVNDTLNGVFLSPPGLTSCNPNPSTCDATVGCTGTNCCCVSQCRPYIVILLTDGDETCGGTPPNAAAALLTTDVTTGSPASLKRYRVITDPIGFGTTVPYQPLEDIAHAGGHPDLPGQNEAYYAQDQAGLELAISQIIEDSVRSEVCNGLDDDCDGKIDEDFPNLGQPCDNGLYGICRGTGTYVCRADGTGTTCDITNPGGTAQTSCPPGDTCNGDGTEICGNGLDDDCDGDIDEGCVQCVPTAEICNGKDDDCDGKIDEDLTRPCGYGACSPNAACCGTQTCVNGSYTGCSATPPTTEICNGIDDDCDGIVDEDLTEACSNITGNGCATPPCPATNNPGDPANNPIPQNVCHPGTTTCVDGSYGACTGEVEPSPEICNGLDDDCDNVIDEDTGGGSCNATCGIGTILCAGAPNDPSCCQPGTCLPGQNQCGTLYCSSTSATGDYTCNKIDDDCDGKVDEDWVCGDPTNQSTPPAPCDCPAPPGFCKGSNACVNGAVTCVGSQPIDPSSCCDCNGNPQNGLCTGGAQCGADCTCEYPCMGGEFSCPEGQTCMNGLCVIDPCFGVTCGTDQMGNAESCVPQGKGHTCVETCTLVSCPAPLICYGPTGTCKPNDCTTFPDMCTAGQQCVVGTDGLGTCVTNPCFGKQCPSGQYCEMGQCYGSCAGVVCPSGQQCQLGSCVNNPCGNPCPSDEVCDDTTGVCIADPCQFRQCPEGQWCNPDDGNCEPDPCLGVTCPGSGQICKGGTCYDASEFLPDGGTHVTVGGGGCAAGGGEGGLGVVLALGAILRRRRGARS